MMRAIQVGWLMLAAGAAVWGGADQKTKPAPAPRPPVARPPVMRNVPPKQANPRLTNPMSPAARLYQATPEQRERVLEKLPPERQEAMRRNLAWFDSLPKEQQRMVLERGERLAGLPREQQRTFVQAWQALQRLPQDRHQAVGAALRRLQLMPEQQRATVMNSEQFRSRFSPEEQKIISDLAVVILPPG